MRSWGARDIAIARPAGRVLFAAALAFSLSSCEGLFDKDAFSKMDTAIRNGSSAEVRKLLDKGVPADIRNTVGRTPLMTAAVGNQLAIMDLLLARKADINRADSKDQTALHLAARWSRKETVRFLLDRGARPNLRDYLTWTPLMWASLQGRTDVAATLLDSGALLSITDVTGNTPVILAAWRGHTDTVDMLLARGGDLSWKNKTGRSAADIAGQNGYPKLAAHLRELERSAPAKPVKGRGR